MPSEPQAKHARYYFIGLLEHHRIPIAGLFDAACALAGRRRSGADEGARVTPSELLAVLRSPGQRYYLPGFGEMDGITDYRPLAADPDAIPMIHELVQNPEDDGWKECKTLRHPLLAPLVSGFREVVADPRFEE